MKQGDIVGKEKEPWLGKVTWVDEEVGQCGVVYTSPSDYQGGANIFKISELKIVGRATEEEMEDINELSIEELRAEVRNLRKQGRRPVGIRKEKSKKQLLADKLKGLTVEQIEKLMES